MWSIIQPGEQTPAGGVNKPLHLILVAIFRKKGLKSQYLSSGLRGRECFGSRGVTSCDRFADAHLFPVVTKLLTAIQAHDIRAVTVVGRQLMSRRQWKGGSVVRASKERVQKGP